MDKDSEKLDNEDLENFEDSLENESELFENETKLKSEIDDLRNQLIRLQADFLNYKNRTEREKSNNLMFANETLILKLLPVLDNFERAFKQLDTNDEVIKGFNMIKEQLESVLSSENVEEIESDLQVFNPEFHNAVITEEKEGIEPGIVLETFEKGYKIKEKVIRPSMVKVSK